MQPNLTAPTTEPAFVLFTPAAVAKVKEAMAAENLTGWGLRVAVVGGGCSGFQYALDFENESRAGDTEWDEDGFRVYVDKMSAGYLEGARVDWVETAMGAGFKFDNPSATTTCGCGSSFS